MIYCFNLFYQIHNIINVPLTPLWAKDDALNMVRKHSPHKLFFN